MSRPGLWPRGPGARSPVAGDLAVLAGGFTGSNTFSATANSWTGSTWIKNS